MDEKRQEEQEQLNAFIDGELDVEARAAVTARAARDAAYARELAALSQLKAATVDSVPVPDLSLPPVPGRRRRHVAMAIAASLVLFVAVGAGWTVFKEQSTIAGDFALDPAAEIHRTWIPQVSGTTPKATAHPVSATLNPSIPDLSANGLDLRYIGADKTRISKDTLVLGYLGSRGCRLTVLVNRAEKTPAVKIVNIEAGPIFASYWRAGPLRYTLLAEGMAQARFRLIANTVHRASLERLPFDKDARTALAQSRANSPPCRA